MDCRAGTPDALGPSGVPVHAMLKAVLALLLSVPFATRAAEPAALSLEATFDAYIRVIAHNDERARDLLKSSLETADADCPHIASSTYGLHAFGGLDEVFNASAAEAIHARTQRIRCEITGIEAVKRDTPEHHKVRYQCLLPDVSAAFDLYRDNRRYFHPDKDEERFAAFLDQYAAIVSDAPDRIHQAEASFYRLGSTGPWIGGTLNDLGSALFERLLPFEEWDERIDADSVAVFTGIPACDLMLDAQMKFAARHYPDDLDQQGAALHENMAEHLKMLGREYSMKYCRAIHDTYRDLWSGTLDNTQPRR
jgi:AcrR family transcriptional regulator